VTDPTAGAAAGAGSAPPDRTPAAVAGVIAGTTADAGAGVLLAVGVTDSGAAPLPQAVSTTAMIAPTNALPSRPRTRSADRPLLLLVFVTISPFNAADQHANGSAPRG